MVRYTILLIPVQRYKDTQACIYNNNLTFFINDYGYEALFEVLNQFITRVIHTLQFW